MDVAAPGRKCTVGLMAAGSLRGQSQSMTSPTTRRPGRKRILAEPGARQIAGQLRRALGYRVETADGCVGALVGVPFSGEPPRPLVLIVRDGECVRFVSVRRVAEVLGDERRILLRPSGGGGT
jgi:hypothetical protein